MARHDIVVQEGQEKVDAARRELSHTLKTIGTVMPTLVVHAIEALIDAKIELVERAGQTRY